jgi:O-antigen/teichoic acid export membrane protein
VNKLVKNTSIYTIGNFLPKITGFVLLPVYSYYLLPAEYGTLSAMTAVMGVLNILLILSIPRSIPRLFFDYEDKEQNKIFFGTIFISVFVIASFQISLLFVFNNTVEKIYKNVPFFPYFKYALLTAFLSVFFNITNAYYRQTGNAARFITYNLINFALITGGAVIMLLVFQNGAESVLKGKFFGSLIIFVLTVYLARKIAVLHFDFKIFKAIILFSLPLIPANIFAWVINMSDRIFIERYFELSLVGIYSMGYQIAMLTSLFGTSIRQAYDPWFFKQAKINTFTSIEKIKKGNNVISIVILFAVFFISLFAKEGIELFLNEKYHSAYIYIPIISLAVFIGQMAGLLNLSFYQEKKTVSLMWVIMVSSILNIGLNFLLISNFGAMGAAWATLLTFVFEFGLKYKIAEKYFKLSLEWLLIGKYMVIMAVIVVVFNYLDINLNIYFLIMTKVFLFVALTAIFYFNNKPIINLIVAKK